MAASWPAWQRRVHGAVVRHLRTPVADGVAVVAPRMPLLSALYGRVVAAKRSRALATAQRLAVPVISVGNVTFGATGKTPCVLFLADYALRLAASQSSRVPMLLTRGYGDDEWRLFASRFPSCKLAVGADRLALGRQRVAHYGGAQQLSCVLLDDGLQQWAIAKDLEIVMIDALAPFGNGKLLPLGSLRELPADALARADVVLLHHANLLPDHKELLTTIQQLTCQERNAVVGTSEMAVTAVPTLTQYASGAFHRDTSTNDWHRFQGKTALVFCGVGNPESVGSVVRAMGCWAQVQLEPFPDHHAFCDSDLEDVRARVAGRHDVVVLTTEKDAARSAASIQRVFSHDDVHVLVSEFRLGVGREAVLNRVKNLIDGSYIQ